MKNPRLHFTQDELLEQVRVEMARGLKRQAISEVPRSKFSNIDCLMSGLAIFTFKFPSLLQFDTACKEGKTLAKNLATLFTLETAPPCDTSMRERLDEIDARSLRPAFSGLFTLLQRGKVLENFRFFGDYYLVSVDGTGVFSSDTIHCQNCCVKNHKNGKKTYYHQMLCAALVHPDQKVVFPFPPEPIMNSDGAKKNDCERNALKRWVVDFRREHPHLKTIILADGLSSNQPFISILKQHNLSYILTCKEKDHKYLTKWVADADSQDKKRFEEIVRGVTHTYEYMENVPLNGSKESCRVTVVRFSETKKGKTTNWMWVTVVPVNLDNIREFVKGARARWKIENETFNTLKNQGYQFEHNFGHGKKHLHTVLATLMLLAFFIDQCLSHVNKRVRDALKQWFGKKGLWELMRQCLCRIDLPSFESLYHHIVHPPPFEYPAV